MNKIEKIKKMKKYGKNILKKSQKNIKKSHKI